MNQSDAIKVLIQTAEIAQKAGALSLEGAAIVLQAVSVFTQQQVEKNLPAKTKKTMEETIVETEETTEAAPESTETVVK